jgi:hypothetical protein
MKQQLAGAGRFMAELRCGAVGADVAIDEEELLALGQRVGVGQVGVAGPQRLDLAPRELETRLERLLDAVVEAGAPVLSDDLPAGVLGRGSRWVLQRGSPNAALSIKRVLPM